jgi:uncharacterized membrane protein YfcA
MSAAVPVIYVLACVAVGVVVGRHLPGSPMGWLLLFFTVLLAGYQKGQLSRARRSEACLAPACSASNQVAGRPAWPAT